MLPTNQPTDQPPPGPLKRDHCPLCQRRLPTSGPDVIVEAVTEQRFCAEHAPMSLNVQAELF